MTSVVLKTVKKLEKFCFHGCSTWRTFCRLVCGVFELEMPVKCAVPTCFSSKGSLTFPRTRVSFFSTPRDSLMLTKWENNIDLMDGQHLTSKSKVCATYAIRKRMTVNFKTLQVDLSVYGMECHTQDVIPKSYTNNSNLSEAIAHFNEMKICSGARLGHHDITQLVEVKNGILKHGTWRAVRALR